MKSLHLFGTLEIDAAVLSGENTIGRVCLFSFLVGYTRERLVRQFMIYSSIK